MPRGPQVTLSYGPNGKPAVFADAGSLAGGASGIMFAGKDGSTARFIAVDGSGRLVAVGAGTAGSPAGGVVTIQGDPGGVAVPVDGVSTGTWMPNPAGQFFDYANGARSQLMLQADGSLATWSTVLTDAGSFRDDFGGSLVTSLSGTVTFTNGSNVVTGSGTSFTSQVNRFSYLKRDTDGESSWTGVGRVVSDTEIILSDLYPGTSGTVGSVSSWQTATGTGGSISSAASILSVVSGATSGERTAAMHGGDYAPMKMIVRFYVSQRVDNQTVYFGMYDDDVSPSYVAAVEMTGDDDTRLTLVTRSSADPADVESTTIRLPDGATTASTLTMRIEMRPDSVRLVYMTALGEIVLAEHEAHVPGPYNSVREYVGIHNTGGAVTSTTLSVDFVSVVDFNELSTDSGEDDSLVKQYEAMEDASYRAVAARGTGGFYPSPECQTEEAEANEASPLQADGEGLLMTRGNVLTDEQSFRTDFPGTSLDTNLTGTCSFTSGGLEVFGTGTLFTQEVKLNQYVKLAVDDEDKWVQVCQVFSDTEMRLDAPYSGSTAVGTGETTLVLTKTGAGGSFAVANSILTISSGTTNSSTTAAYRYGDYCPMMVKAYVSLSQRIANQEFWVGMVDDLDSPGARVLAVFSGTDNTLVKLVTASSAAAADREEITVSLPNGMTTASSNAVELTLTPTSAYLSINSVKIAEIHKHLPGIYESLTPMVGFVNGTGAASSTNALVDVLFFNNHDRVEVANSFEGDTLSVSIREDVHTLSGYFTTTTTAANQVIASYTVPTGKSLFVVGFVVSAGDSTTNGAPVKLGKGTMTETASPGAVDGAILRAFELPARQSVRESMPTPLYLATAGEVVKVTVTPSATTSTVWRTNLDFVLR